MKVSALHPELQTTAYRMMRSLPFHNKLFHALVSRLQKLAPGGIKAFEGVRIEDVDLPNASLRLYRPERKPSGAGLLWIHGGGYIIGNVSTNDGVCVQLVRDLGLVVTSVEYRLAPAHPFPAALDDCFDAWKAMQGAAGDWGFDPARIVVTGQSAGGGLAAALVQRIADAGGTQPAGQLLMYPMLDDRTAADRTLDDIGHVLWNNRNNRAGWEWYLGRAPGAASLPEYAAPARRVDLAGLPPAWIGVGELDLFYDENVNYAQRLRQAGVDCDLHTDPGAPHAYDLMAPGSSLARGFVADYYRFLGERLAL